MGYRQRDIGLGLMTGVFGVVAVEIFCVRT